MVMAPPILSLQNISFTLGGTPLLAEASLSASAGEKICLVGRNGCGKSTLLKIAAGHIEPDNGTTFFQPGARLCYLPQEADLYGHASTRAYVEAGLRPGEAPHHASALLAALGLTGTEVPERLSGGEARRAALAQALAPKPDVLLLDEPTNHLDLPAIEWLEAELKASPSAMIIVSHDRMFLNNLAERTVWLDRGRTRLFGGGFSQFEEWRDTLLEKEERAKHKFDRKIAAEEDWLRYGVTARRKRNQKRLEGLAAMRAERRQRIVSANLKMEAAEAGFSSKLVIEARRIAKNFGERPVVKDFSARILRGDRLGIVGANGAGKTTLIRLLTGSLAPGTGMVRLGANVLTATLDQDRASLGSTTVLKDVLTGGGSDYLEINGERKHVIGYMRDFLFVPEQARTPVGKLSGGERGRLMLARALAKPSNLLVLDEPTNDLDLETLDLLQEMLASYTGTILIVSHDRDFLDRVATSVVVAEGGGRWIEYAGGYSDMVKQRGAGIGAPSSPVPAPVQSKPKPAAARQREPKPAANRRLNFNEQQALAVLPARIDELRALKDKLEALLGDAALYARDPQKFVKATAALENAEAELMEAEDEWLRLALLRETAKD
jgi:ABC transport system ATP-binding/permease protein